MKEQLDLFGVFDNQVKQVNEFNRQMEIFAKGIRYTQGIYNNFISQNGVHSQNLDIVVENLEKCYEYLMRFLFSETKEIKYIQNITKEAKIPYSAHDMKKVDLENVMIRANSSASKALSYSSGVNIPEEGRSLLTEAVNALKLASDIMKSDWNIQ